MRHRDARQRLKQKPAHARMLKRNLVTSLLLYESVRTTRARAKAVQPVIDRLITIAKKRPPYLAIRSINRVITDRNASRKIMEVFKDRYAGRSSGLTRMTPVGVRKGDGALLVDISLVAEPEAVERESVTTAKNAKRTKSTKNAEKSSQSLHSSPASQSFSQEK